MSEDTKACPFCGEQILAVAIKCNHCRSNIDANPTAVPSTQNTPGSGFQAIARDKKTFSQEQMLWALLICSVICYFISEYSRPLGIIVLLGLAGGTMGQVRSVRERIVVGLAGAFLTLVLFCVTADRPAKPSEAAMPVPIAATPPTPATPPVPQAVQAAPEPAQGGDQPAANGIRIDGYRVFQGQDEKTRRREERKRLDARRFIGVSPDALAERMLAAVPNHDEVFETKYQGKYVHWRGKYERRGIIVEFVASAGTWSAFSCKDFDPTQEGGSFEADRWDDIAVEGRLDGLQHQLEKSKVEFVLTECIARKGRR